ncbi:MAG: CRISPR-associated endonuclease Cas2 [Anaerolineae bacterium]|nr:CRISPR-associated endonuclease Cas2 [Anaerolineae bacterium]
MLRVLVIYDISDDKVRYRISETCLDYGLDRQQYSVFTGLLKPTHVRELAKVLERITRQGQVIVLPVASDDWERRTVIGEGA